MKIEYLDEQGKYEISYSQKLQAEDIKLKRQLFAVVIAGCVLLAILIVLFALLLSGGTITRLLHNTIC